MTLEEEHFSVRLHKAAVTLEAEGFFWKYKDCPDLFTDSENDSARLGRREERTRSYEKFVGASHWEIPQVWFALGHAYYHGWGTEESPGLAVYWYRKAADSGHTDAMLHLAYAIVSMSGSPSEAEKREARGWYQRAVNLGNRGWMSWLRSESRRDYGVDEDYEEALGWFGKAFTKTGSEDPAALRRWGYMAPDRDALDYFLRIAATGEPESCFFLGLLFGDPAAPFCDLEKAMDWMIQAVERKSRNSPRAKLELAWHCFLGSGNVRDIEGGYGWLESFYDEPVKILRMQHEARRLLSMLDDLIDQQFDEGV